MDLYDQHLHSRHSFDSKADPAENVQRAIELGLAGLTFTEHFDTNPDDWEGCVYNDQAYSETIEQLRSRFGSEIFIGKGIEVCFQPPRMDFTLDFLSRHQFDMVMLSVHYFGDQAVHVRRNWDGIDIPTGTNRYLENVLAAVRFCEKLHADGSRVFDVLGHLDLVKRYTQRFLGGHDVLRYGELLDQILKTCIKADVTPEINTSTLRQGLDVPMPGQEIISRFIELGGQAITFGSDAHRSADIGADFDHALKIAREACAGYLAVYKHRERNLLPIV